MNIQDKIAPNGELAREKVQEWKSKNKTIVFTNGCFDILHTGHVLYLQDAARLGDKLIIGLNSDSSVRALKGKDRPINAQNERAIVLSALGMVDLVVIFEQETPLSLIKTIMPDVLVKGGDWSVDKIVGADTVSENGGLVKSLPFHNGYSSTAIIEKLKDEN